MQVKGMAFNARLDFVKDRFSDEKLAAVMDKVPHVKEMCAASDGFYPSRLYDYKDYTAFNQAICDVLYDGKEKAYTEMGEYSAEGALTTVHKVFVMKKDVRSLLRSLPVIYSAYFIGLGAVTVDVSEVENLAKAKIQGVASPHRSLCQVVLGYMKHGMELCGATNVFIVEETCMCKGGDSCNVDARWS